MNTVTKTLTLALICACLFARADKTTVWRDSQGRVLGTATTDSYGKTTYRDSMGRMTGSKTVK